MKKLQCKDLGGPCEVEVVGETFEEIGNACKAHVMAEMQKGDAAHQEAVEKWKSMTSEQFKEQMAVFQRRFEEAEKV